MAVDGACPRDTAPRRGAVGRPRSLLVVGCLAAAAVRGAAGSEALASRRVELRNGAGSIPILGLGTADASASGPPYTCADAVEAALRQGYRHIDTAVFYENHADIAEGIARSGVLREEVFITSKIAMHGEKLKGKKPGAATTHQFVEEMLRELKTEYVDLVLMHFPGVEGKGQPVGRGIEMDGDVSRSSAARREIWGALELEVVRGRVRNIGVSNFLVPHLEELASYSAVLPAMNQLELHPYLPRRDTLKWCADHGVVVTAYGSILQDIYQDLIKEPVTVEIAARVVATPAQVALAWALEQGIVVVPKSSKPHRIEENAKALDVRLTKEDMQRLDALDCASNKGCRSPTRCGDVCTPGTYYWDPALVPAAPAKRRSSLKSDEL